MKLFVVTCKVEGCEECNNSYTIVGGFSSKERAEVVRKQHDKRNHLHPSDIDITEIVVDEIQKVWCSR